MQRFLAMAGIGARRDCEEFVTSGRVTVDGNTVTDLGFRVEPDEHDVRLDGERVRLKKRVYYMLNKPPGVLCTNYDQAGRPLAVQMIPQTSERLFTVGRLDEHSQGLLIVTNDGELANRLAHPRYQVRKTYRVHVQGTPTKDELKEMTRGMYFAEGRFKAREARLHKSGKTTSVIDIVLTEGQNREIRRLLARQGHKVLRLTRVALGNLHLGDLPVGASRPLTAAELKDLRGMSQTKRPAGRRQRTRNPTAKEQSRRRSK